MHIPDGFLSVPVSLACAILAAPAVSAAAARARTRMGPSAVAMVGVTAAFVFAAQMLNFPVAGGTSGHLIGGVLAAVLLGPSAAVVIMTAVLATQCLVFGDGGLLALGANVLNMAILHPLVGFAVYRVVAGHARPVGERHARRIAAAAFASWVATIASAATCAGELVLSRVGAPSVVLPAMVGVHAVIGLGEALITAIVLSLVMRMRPELVDRAAPVTSASRPGTLVVLGLAASLALGLFVSPFACPWPDGLERVVERLGIEPSRAILSAPAPLRGYTFPGPACRLAHVDIGGRRDRHAPRLRRLRRHRALARPASLGTRAPHRPSVAVMSGVHVLRTHADLDSPIHRLPASRKLVATLVVVACLAFVPVAHAGWTLLALGAVASSLARRSLSPSSTFAARLALAQPFVLGVSVLALFQGRGLSVFAALAIKSTACVAAVQLLAQTTRATDMIDALRRAWMPDTLVLAFALLYRYLFVLVDESARMRRARLARTWRSTRWTSWRALASVVAVSFVRSIARAERIAAAMRARGWS